MELRKKEILDLVNKNKDKLPLVFNNISIKKINGKHLEKTNTISVKFYKSICKVSQHC